MSCTTDMLSFKGYVHRWLATATQVAPFLTDTVMPVLRTSAEAAISTCTGEANGRACGFKWNKKVYDGSHGAGQQMNVLGAITTLLIGQAKVPLTNSTGGTSIGDPNAGSHSDTFSGHSTPLTTGDKAGAGVLTFVILGAAIGTFGWMSTGI